MRSAYSSIWGLSLMAAAILSASVLSGCAGAGSASLHTNDAPSLRAVRTWRIVQVPANRYPEIRRDAPYYILCSDCPQSSSHKTPVLRSSGPSLPLRPEHHSSGSPSTVNIKNAFVSERIALDPYRVFFDYASAQLDGTARQTLNRFIQDYRNRSPRLIVTGYTDSVRVPNGSVSNRWLALQRAVSVKKHIIALGYPKDKVSLEAKYLCCYIDSNDNPSGRRHNRRAELSIIRNP